MHADISREFDAVLKDRNVLGIDDSNLILKNIIDGSDAPFVYEKTGVRYENFLLDEFQDTSGIQWENFRPLLENSVSQNFDCLVVGDVKQSIYRWRGSDWKLLQHSLESELPHCRTTVLDSNFRSRKNIVEFNNDFFTYAAGELDRVYGSGTAVSDIYSDVRQKVTSAALDPGMVEATFCSEDAESDIVVRTIRNLVAGGARYGDIAVLVRNNDSGEKTAEVLIGDSIPVLTDDSLKISSSGMVRQIVSMLSAMDNPQDTASGFATFSLNADMPDSYRSLPDLCEALIRSLKDAGGYDSDAQATYIQSFMDCVMDFSARNGNSIHDFLEYWNEKVLYVTSPSLSDAVRIITVHKSKGLDFDYVIFPYAEKVDLFRKTDVWCCPDFSGTALEPAGRGLYDVTLSGSSVDTLFEKDILCGFVASIEELGAWDGADRAQLILDTRPVHGNLEELCPAMTEDDVRRAVLQGACAIHHASSHNILHARNWSILPELYKSARFTIRMKHYLLTGVYVSAFGELATVVGEEEKTILEVRNPSTEGDAFMLLEWASKTMREINGY